MHPPSIACQHRTLPSDAVVLDTKAPAAAATAAQNSRPPSRAASANACTRPWYMKPPRSNATLTICFSLHSSATRLPTASAAACGDDGKGAQRARQCSSAGKMRGTGGPMLLLTVCPNGWRQHHQPGSQILGQNPPQQTSASTSAHTCCSFLAPANYSSSHTLHPLRLPVSEVAAYDWWSTVPQPCPTAGSCSCCAGHMVQLTVPSRSHSCTTPQLKQLTACQAASASCQYLPSSLWGTQRHSRCVAAV